MSLENKNIYDDDDNDSHDNDSNYYNHNYDTLFWKGSDADSSSTIIGAPLSRQEFPR